MEKEQRERLIEEENLEHVINVIDDKEATLLEKASKLKRSVIALRSGFWDDVTVNIDEPDDAIETEASIKQQAELLAERERSHGLLTDQLTILRDQKDSPYFGRIDFLEDGEKAVEQLYIGLASLMDETGDDFLVYDWRAPISSLYYDYVEGAASFTTDYGKISGEISLKRQFIIERSQLMGMFDTGVTIGDHLLQQALGNNASTTMKNIVATIQAEQNKIIRNESSKYLIVQGVAGSGKTSAALQRVAYLMYRHRNVLNEDNMVLFSPNPLFNSYVANILPELGEENMRQTTFLKYIAGQIDEEIQLESPFSQMEYILTQQTDPNYDVKIASIDLKSSLDYKDVIDDYLLTLRGEGVLFKDLMFRGQVFISHDEMSSYFYKYAQEMTLANAISYTAERILERLAVLKEKEKQEDWVMAQVELLSREDFLRASQHAQEVEEKEEFYDSSAEEEFLLEEIVTHALAPLKAAIRAFEFVDVLATYQNLFYDFTPEIVPDRWVEMREQSQQDFAKNILPFEDATPYAYFKASLLATNADRSVRYLFVDEAQDYTAFQLAYLQHIFPYTRMTFLGDVNQAIYAHTKEGNPLQATFAEQQERIVLTRSYRSTKQIVEFTRTFSPTNDPIESFERHGSRPRLVQLSQDAQRVSAVIDQVTTLQAAGEETIAIICKTFAEVDALYEELKEHIEVDKIHEQSAHFQKGILILPIYLAKGIEFDAVVIPDASLAHYHDDLDQSLFYTACTRAMHELVLVATGEPTHFITDAPSATYEQVTL